ncbi:MAG: ATP-binding cassette domain-containing protein [Pelagibacterales bacterium]|nr:ATP-binding cassette domain-containing protein [Pelagibacterales bacterium]
MLKISNLSLGYDGKEIIKIDNLNLKKSDQILIKGNSGCGKTTLIHTIAGLKKALGGTIFIDDINISNLSESKMDKFRGQNIGIIFQNLHLVKSLNISENLLLSFYLNDLEPDKKRVEEILDALGILDLQKKLPYQISQGQAQRVAIARSILLKPKLILADELTSSLDDENCFAVANLLKKIATQNSATLIISTHDQRLNQFFSNQINL